MKTKTLFLGAALAVTALFLSANTASAQHRGGGYGHPHGGHYHGGYGGYGNNFYGGNSLSIGFGNSFYAPRPVYYPAPVFATPYYGNNFVNPGFSVYSQPVVAPVVVGQSYIAPIGLAPGFATSPVYRTYQYAPGVVGYNTTVQYSTPGVRLGVSVFR
jgi:hypothetical protein